MPTTDELMQDQAFQSAPLSEQLAYLHQTDPDFHAASNRDQSAYLAHVTNLKGRIQANPPAAAGPHVTMQPSVWGSAESMGPDAVQRGRKAAGRAFPGIHGPTQFDASGMPEYQKPTAAEDASNAALVGATLTAPFTGGQSLLTRMGLMGAGAGVGSVAGQQLHRPGTLDPNQTAGDVANWGVSELAGSTLAGGVRNAGTIGRGLWEGTKAAAGRTPFIGPPIRAGLRAAMREWNPGPEVERAITRQMVPEYAGELEEGESEALTTSRSQLIQRMGGKPVEAITQKPTGRLVLSPEEVQAETQQMSLAKKMASQRGMQYAAGMRPQD